MRLFKLFFLLMFIFNVQACDLNHDWELYDTSLQRDIDARTVLNNLIPRLDPKKRYMILEVRDLYQKMGYEKLHFIDDHFQKMDNESKTRPPADVLILQKNMMNAKSKQVIYLPYDEQQQNKHRLYDKDYLNELKKKYQVDAFISVKLRNYAIVAKEYRDRYDHNKDVYKFSQEHVVEMTYAVLNSKGRYLEFKDWKGIITLENIFQQKRDQKRDQERVKIVDKFFNSDKAGYIVKEYYLGLGSIKRFSKTMVGLLEL
ncbi:MAG: hypothetical protein KC646_15270 [Candidatus Cloacimonetes bacterium]|nr:hypothetical protein [Candidatus Cloacimonadota bacterium]